MLVNLLTEKIQFANAVILTKTRDAARKIIKALSPDARPIETDHSPVTPEAILDTGLFDFERAPEHPLWAKEFYGFAYHVTETGEYGIASFVCRARKPFHPARVHRVLNGDLPGLIRAKGHFWLAPRPNCVEEFSLAGAVSSVTRLGGRRASVPRERWPTHPVALAEVAGKWAEPWGDRWQETVFIGAGMVEAALRAARDSALVAAADFTPEAWRDLPDPFPEWRRKQAV